ncbi:hypothetical protein BDF19DRAFT_426593 [Syncephalis fuscata]|nr:hypothetical protein BDF19DRAFT_426593 [Syncephalis fuscata]
MENLLNASEPYFRVDLGIHLPVGVYLPLIGAHMFAHYQLLRNVSRLHYAHVRYLTGIIVVSMILLPLWRGVNPEHPLIDMGVSFGCVFSAIRIGLLTAAATRPLVTIDGQAVALTNKKDDDALSSNLAKASVTANELPMTSFNHYIRHMYLEESALPENLAVALKKQPNDVSTATSVAIDAVQARLIDLANSYDAWLKSIGWHTVPFWIRYPLPPLAYLLAIQFPLAVVSRNVDFLTFYSIDATAAAFFFEMSPFRAFVHWTVVILSLTFALYLGMLMWYGIVFDLVQWAVGAPIRRDLFRRPWLTSSPRDLWGRRWNLPVQASLAEAAYRPICSLLDAVALKTCTLGRQAKPIGAGKLPSTPTAALPRPLRRVNRFIAGFGVFCFSAIIHEYTLSVAFGRSDFDHLRFFCFHGLLVIGYTLLETAARALLPAVLLPNGSLPFVLGWLITWLCMAASSQWFFKPYIRGGLVENLVYYAFL